MYFTDVVIYLKSAVSAVTEGSNYAVNITVEPTTLMASFDVILQTYSCGGCTAANCKEKQLIK